MSEPARAPYEGYTLYKVWHKQEKRWMANLVKHYANDRTTMSLARYMMAVHLGRILNKDEHVDHINNNKTDDRIENFQLLTRSENTKKNNALKPKKMIECTCRMCGQNFVREFRNFKLSPDATCSRVCGRKSSAIKLSKPPKEKLANFEGQRNKYKNPELIVFLKLLKDCGYSQEQISLLTNIPKTTVRGLLKKVLS